MKLVFLVGLIFVTQNTIATQKDDFSVSGELAKNSHCTSGVSLDSAIEGKAVIECATFSPAISIDSSLLQAVQAGFKTPSSQVAIQATGYHLGKLVVITAITQL